MQRRETLCDQSVVCVWLGWFLVPGLGWCVLPVSRSPRVMSPKRCPEASVVGVGVRGSVSGARV